MRENKYVAGLRDSSIDKRQSSHRSNVKIAILLMAMMTKPDFQRLHTNDLETMSGSHQQDNRKLDWTLI